MGNSSRKVSFLIGIFLLLSGMQCAGEVKVTAPPVPPAVTISIGDVTMAEGSGGGASTFRFPVSLSAPAPAGGVTMTYATSDGTALSASDYTPVSATLNIAAGNNAGTIPVLVNADTLFEANQTFTVTLSNPFNATIGIASATGTILNDDVGGVNDTGTNLWGDALVNNLPSTQVAFPGQDADVGRDASILTNSAADGRLGFSFTKLDTAGVALVNQAATYGVTPWDCVQDNVTGLMWEVKTPAFLGGLRDSSYKYTWYNSTGVNDAGTLGTPNGGTCVDALNCDTEKYVAAVNAAGGMCGFTGWRLPNKEELRSLVDLSVPQPGFTIDTGYFPNTGPGVAIYGGVFSIYWTASPYADLATAAVSGNAWNVFFIRGNSNSNAKLNPFYIRLVRDGL